MALSWNEIKDRALDFSKEWESTISSGLGGTVTPEQVLQVGMVYPHTASISKRAEIVKIKL